MRARRGSPVADLLSFGGRVPPEVGGLIAALVVFSILGIVAGLVQVGAFVPALVLRGEVWRLVSWPFFERDPLSLLFGGLMLYWFGRDLCWAWGARRFLTTFFAVAVLSAAITTALSFVLPALAGGAWTGAWPVLTALIVAWASIFPDRQLLLMFALPVSGRTLLWITVGGTVLWAVFGGFAAYVPHLVAQALMALYLRGISARGLWQSYRIRSLERKARRRATHLKVVHKNGGDDPPRWMN